MMGSHQILCVLLMLTWRNNGIDARHGGNCPVGLMTSTSCESDCEVDEDCNELQKCCQTKCDVMRCQPIVFIEEPFKVEEIEIPDKHTSSVVEGGVSSGDTGSPAYNPACPMPMCSQFCEEYAADEQGCMTCECVSKQTKREKCPGNQEWTDCGSTCTPTCENPLPACPRMCVPRCECPYVTPVWDGSQCITPEQCQDRCRGGMIWTNQGTGCTPTCWDKNPTGCSPLHTFKCACPPEAPLWDDVSERCTHDDGCPIDGAEGEGDLDDEDEEEKINDIWEELEELNRILKAKEF